MKSEVDAVLDDLLARWHKWRSGYTLGGGYAGTSSMFRDAPPGKSMYSRDADADDLVEDAIMKGVDAAVERVPNEPPWRLCLQFEARNLASRAQVWTSRSLPTGEALQVLRMEARNRLMRELHGRGLVGV